MRIAIVGCGEVGTTYARALLEAGGPDLVLVDPVTLEQVPEYFRGEALLAVAARVGTTRLIDNMEVPLRDADPERVVDALLDGVRRVVDHGFGVARGLPVLGAGVVRVRDVGELGQEHRHVDPHHARPLGAERSSASASWIERASRSRSGIESRSPVRP